MVKIFRIKNPSDQFINRMSWQGHAFCLRRCTKSIKIWHASCIGDKTICSVPFSLDFSDFLCLFFLFHFSLFWSRLCAYVGPWNINTSWHWRGAPAKASERMFQSRSCLHQLHCFNVVRLENPKVKALILNFGEKMYGKHGQ